MVRGEQGRPTPRPNTARSPMSSSSRKTSPTRRRSPTSRSRRTTTRTSRALHDAGNAHDRAARASRRRKPPRRRSIRIADRRDLRGPRQGSRARRRPTCSSARFAKDKVPDPAVAEAAFTLQRQRGQPDRHGRLRAGAGARHRDQRRKSCKPLAEVDGRNPQGSGARRSEPHPARRARLLRGRPRRRRNRCARRRPSSSSRW